MEDEMDQLADIFSEDETPTPDDSEAEARAPEDEDGEAPENDDIENEDDAEPEAEKAEDEADDDAPDEDVVRWGEGEDAKEVSLTDLIEAYENPKVDYEQAPQVQQRVQQLQSAEQQATTEAQGHLAERTRVAQALEQVDMMLGQVSMPDTNLIITDPAEYNRQLMEAQAAERRRDEVAKAYHANQQRMQELQAHQDRQHMQQQQMLLQSAWPEYVTDPNVRDSARKFVGEKYGITDELFESVTNHEFFSMVRDLMQFHAQKDVGQKATATLKAGKAPVRVKSRKAAGKAPSKLDQIQAQIRAGKTPSENDLVSSLEALM